MQRYINYLLHSKIVLIFTLLLSLNVAYTTAQEIIKPIKYGDFENWTVRTISESSLIGGKDKTLYVVGPTDTIIGNKAYEYGVKTPWSCSNAYANVIGIAKASNSMYPEKRGDDGTCAHLGVILETVKVLGMVDISVIVSGTMFLGKTLEPVRNTNDPYKKIDMGIPFTEKPKAIAFDYKTKISPINEITKSNGFKLTKYAGHDAAMIFVYLQKRWEDEDGNIYAKRIGTAHLRFEKSVSQWQNDFRMPIHYGDISATDYYKPYMALFSEGNSAPYCSLNSKGKMVPINEIGWGSENDTPTHIIVMFSSSTQQAFWGTVGNTLWVDNVKFVY